MYKTKGNETILEKVEREKLAREERLQKKEMKTLKMMVFNHPCKMAANKLKLPLAVQLQV
jgi:hypothetical protein